MVISLTVNPEAPEESILYIHLYSTLEMGTVFTNWEWNFTLDMECVDTHQI